MIFLKKPILWFIFLSSFLIYIAQRTDFPLPKIINNYYNNLMCMPVVLTICLVVLQKLRNNLNLRIPIFAIASLTLYYMIYFEWYLPKVNSRYTADFIDVILYALGAIIFYLMQNKWIKKQPKH